MQSSTCAPALTLGKTCEGQSAHQMEYLSNPHCVYLGSSSGFLTYILSSQISLEMHPKFSSCLTSLCLSLLDLFPNSQQPLTSNLTLKTDNAATTWTPLLPYSARHIYPQEQKSLPRSVPDFLCISRQEFVLLVIYHLWGQPYIQGYFSLFVAYFSSPSGQTRPKYEKRHHENIEG